MIHLRYDKLDEIVDAIRSLNFKELNELVKTINENPIFSHSITGKSLIEEVRDAILYVIKNSERHFEVQEHRTNIGGVSITVSVLGTPKGKSMRDTNVVYSGVIEDTSEIKDMVYALMIKMERPFINVGLVYDITLIPEVVDDLEANVSVEVISGVV